MRVEIPCNGHWLSPHIGGYLAAGHWLSRRILVFILPHIGGYLAADRWLSGCKAHFFQIVPLVI